MKHKTYPKKKNYDYFSHSLAWSFTDSHYIKQIMKSYICPLKAKLPRLFVINIIIDH